MSNSRGIYFGPRRRGRNSTLGNVRISGGAVIPQIVARIVCRCKECLGPVEQYNNSLFCVADKSHKGWIHRDDAAIELERRQAQMEQVVESGYTVEGGKLVGQDPLEGETKNGN